MKPNSEPERITATIRLLSDPESFSQMCHKRRQGDPMPSIRRIEKAIGLIREIIFPGYFGETSLNKEITGHYMGVYVNELNQLLSNEILAGYCFDCPDPASYSLSAQKEKAEKTAADFIEHLPEIRRMMVKDIDAIYLGDPAAVSHGEVIFCYPAVRAITNYRIAHCLAQLKVPLIPRYISEMAHSETGIDIHPEAVIGESFSIDHGTGVVIGSTCVIGNHVKIYQGVTLGARSFETDNQGNPVKGIPRHPIVEDNVVIYAGATILGRITIGKNSVIGGNVWITKDVPAYSKIAQGRVREGSFSWGAGI
jgi:serine O-acetyltransferase